MSGASTEACGAFVINSFYLAQLVDDTLLRREQGHDLLQECEDLLPVYVSCCGNRQLHLFYRLTVTPAVTQLVVAATDTDGVEPGGDGVARIVAAGTGPEAYESLLHGIVGRGTVGQEAVG